MSGAHHRAQPPAARTSPDRSPRLLPPRAADAVLVGVGVFGLFYQQQAIGSAGPTWQAVLYAAVTPQLLWWRRSHPTAVHLAVALLTSTVPFVLTGPGFLHNNGLVLAMATLFAVGCYEARSAARRAVLAVTAVVVSVPYAFLPPGSGFTTGDPDVVPAAPRFDPENIPVLALVLVGCYAIGRLAGLRQAHVLHLQERLRLTEDARLARQQAAVADERLRLARELHDSVAHHATVMVVQAGAARQVLHLHPERAERAMTAVEDSGRRALAEMRRMVHTLAEEPDPHPDDPCGLDHLVDRLRAAGLAVRVTAVGAPTAGAGPVRAATHRIVQEALTNVLRHSDADRADVRIEWGPDAVTVDVTDRGPSTRKKATAAPGHGISGMRSRAAELGGTLSAASDGCGFSVHAVLPGSVRTAAS